MNEREKFTLPPPEVAAAAVTLRANFEEAKEEGHYVNGWYARMSKWNIEVLIDFVLGPLVVTPPVLAPLPPPEALPPLEAPPGGGVYDLHTDTYTTGCGQGITNVHAPGLCVGRGCVIHHPSDHHMRDWPTNWRDGGMFDIKPPHMERICPHGIGHPDPDDRAFQGEGAIGVHGCDGCCTPPKEEK